MRSRFVKVFPNRVIHVEHESTARVGNEFHMDKKFTVLRKARSYLRVTTQPLSNWDKDV